MASNPTGVDKDYLERKKLSENIGTLAKSECDEIFRILRRYEQSFTENSNGIFFDMSSVSNEAYIAMKQYMNFCLNNRVAHEERVHVLSELPVKKDNSAAVHMTRSD